MKNNDKYILGLNIGNHDSSSALLKNGELVIYIEQERISRNKLSIGEPPIDAIIKCLEVENISMGDIAAIAVGMDWCYRNKNYRLSENELKKYKHFEDCHWFLQNDLLENCKPNIHAIRHHLAHAASAYRLSGFEDSAILVVDNRGEDASTSLAVGKNGKIEFIKQFNIHNSLGIFYNRAAEYAGLYGKYREVGKFMGLASYGKKKMRMPLQYSGDGFFFKNLENIEDLSICEAINARARQLNSYFKDNCFPYGKGDGQEIMAYANFAASAQSALETILINIVGELKKQTKLDNLVIAGGVAQNCSANGKIEESGIFKKIYIPPFASDAGTAVGAALELSYQLTGKKGTLRPLKSASLGIAYSEEEIVKALASVGERLTYCRIAKEELPQRVAERIVSGEIVGWMQSRFEAGPRALGNRSILADPRTRSSLIKLNKIKNREMWRPIAPSILYGHYNEYFSGAAGNKNFMNISAKVKTEKQHVIPAVTHVDGTARPQIVTQQEGVYYDLIKSFYALTGVPVVCNTSFNTQGMPLVNSPKDALDCLLNCDLEYIYIENFEIKKNW